MLFRSPFGLGLGPDLPWADEPSPGILRLSTVKILTLLSLLIPAFSLLPRPHVLPVVLLPIALCSPTILEVRSQRLDVGSPFLYESFFSLYTHTSYSHPSSYF